MTVMVWGPVRQDIKDLLAEHPDDVPAVVDRLTELQTLLDRVPPLLDGNPLADFNRLFLRITTNVLETLYAGGFADPAFLSRLVVEVAARYFDAIRSWSEASACCPRVWSLLFDRIAGPDRRPLSSASAGVNAQISFDLPFALVTTFDHLGTDPIDDSDQHHDYLQINALFGEAVPGLSSGYLDRWQVLIDAMTGNLGDRCAADPISGTRPAGNPAPITRADLRPASFGQATFGTAGVGTNGVSPNSVGPNAVGLGGVEALSAYSRNVAWRTAQRLWAMRHDQPGTAAERARLDGHAVSVSRLLLSPMGSFLR